MTKKEEKNLSLSRNLKHLKVGSPFPIKIRRLFNSLAMLINSLIDFLNTVDSQHFTKSTIHAPILFRNF